ncbi:unnamed protein product, partial [Medioppia subpectinata]
MSENNIISLDKPFDEIPNISMGELISKALNKLDEEFVCAFDANTGKTLTAKELIEKSTAIAMALIERGINKTDLILTFAENSIELTVVLFASVLLGVTIYPITSIAKAYELEKLFETLDSIVVFTSESKSNIISKILTNTALKANVKSIFVVNGVFDNNITFNELLKEGFNKSLPQIPYFAVEDPKNTIFAILQSSGTTGVPKSTLISHYAFVAQLYSMINSGMNFDEFDERLKFGHITPIGCITGLTFLYGYICCGIDANSDTKLTFKELITKSNALAMALIEREISKSDIILTFAENSIELAIVIMASVLLGTTLYPISPIANVYELEKLFETLDSLVVFTSQSKSNAMKTILNNHKSKAAVKSVFMVNGVFDNYITFDELLKEGHNKCLPQIPYFAVKDPRNETFVILQSSGTTGVPKSQLISNYSVVAYLHAMKSDIESDFHKNNIDGQPVFGHITPFGCVSGISSLLGYIFCGFSVVIFREYSEELILKSIEKYHVHILFITPAFGSALILGPFAGKYDLSSLKVIISSGAAFTESVGKAIVNKYDVLLQEIYGMTEGGIITQMPYFNNGDEYMAGNLGQPNNNVEIKIRDTDSGESLGPGLGGEICVRGPMLFKGYLNNPLATSEAIDSEGWLRTGDIGHYDQQKRLFITDRLKELIKYETIAVSPTEIELFLLTHK